MKKRIFAVLLAAAMTFSLAACGGSSEESAEGEGTKTEDGAPEQEVVKMELWYQWKCSSDDCRRQGVSGR